jgi:hypothetical protein
MQVWIFGFGLFYAEGFATAAFMGGLILLVESSQAKRESTTISLGTLSGVMFAMAAYFRASYSLLETGLAILTLISGLLWLAGKGINGVSKLKQLFYPILLTTSSAWVAMFLLMEPWLRFVESAVRFERSWSVVGGNFLRGAWLDRLALPDFLQEGGAGWACILNLGACVKVNEFEQTTGGPFPSEELSQMTIQAIFQNPGLYILDRFHFFYTGWFSLENTMGSPGYLWGVFYLIAVVFLLITTIKRILNRQFIYVFVMLALGILIAPLMIGHVEPRYFIPVKLLILLIPWLLQPSSQTMRTSDGKHWQ